MTESGRDGDAQSVRTTVGKESAADGEGSESDGFEMNISWLFGESSASDTSAEKRLEQRLVGLISEALHSALGEVQVEMHKVKTEFKAELKVIGDRIERIEEDIATSATERSAGQQLKYKEVCQQPKVQNKTQAQLEVEYPLGTRVAVNSFPLINGFGTVRYVGELQHYKGWGLWIGVELDEPKWRHNGTVEGVEYFCCPENCGIFVPQERVSRLLKKSEFPQVGTRVEVDSQLLNCRGFGTVMSLEETEFGKGGMWMGVTLDNGSKYESLIRKDHFGLFVRPWKIIWTEQTEGPVKEPSVGEGGWNLGIGDVKNPSGNAESDAIEQLNGTPLDADYPPLGTRVEVDTIKYGPVLGTVKFVGETEFDKGMWIGVELDEPKGNHKGTYEGVKYFDDCKENYGILVRPRRVYTKPSEDVDEVKVVGGEEPSRSGEGVLAIKC